jgi:hypothetical protein
MNDLTALPPDSFAAVGSLLAAMQDPRGFAERLKLLDSKLAELRKAEAAVEQAKVAQAKRDAELDKRAAAIRDGEYELHTRKQLVEGRHAELSTHARHLSEVEGQIKLRLLRHAGALHNFNPAIQSIPDWAAVDRELGSAGDVHYDGNDTTTVRDEAGENEVPENLVAGSSLTRSRARPPRPSRGADA